MHAILEIPELARLQAGQGLVRIPDQQDVPFTPRVRELVDSPEFRRLARISQLGLVSRVYPGAMHTRFEHALGVFHNALRYLGQLAKDARFRALVDVHDAEVLMVAALLHDLGHWPFCHPIEDLGLAGLPAHEELAARFLQPGRELARVLVARWGVEPREVLGLLVQREDAPKLRLLRSILSGPIDIDKMDYLERDSLHCGVPYGRHFDKNRLIQSLVLNAAGDGLALSSKGKTAAELMVFARYVMFSEVYWHHAVRAATCMLARAFYELRAGLNLGTLFEQSEDEMVRTLWETAQGTECRQLLEGVFGAKRALYKRVLECHMLEHAELYELLTRRPYAHLCECGVRLCRELGALLGERWNDIDILVDAPPAHREVEFRVDLYFPKPGTYRPLHEVSPVVRALAGTQFDDYVKRVRVYARAGVAARLASLPDLAQRVAVIVRQVGA